MSRGKILVVEDEFVVAENLRSDLESIGYQVVDLASSGAEAIQFARRDEPDLVLMDVKLTGQMDGVETAIHLRRELNLPVLFLTAFADENLLERAKLAEPLGYLVKPYERKGLQAGIEMATYKARTERLLRESESRFRAMFENSPVAYQALDRSDRCLDLNAELCELLGYGREELIGRSFADFWAPEKRDSYLEEIARLKEYGGHQLELELVRKDGMRLTVVSECRAQRDIEGRFLCMHCILFNITERKRVEEERLQITRRIQQVQKAESLARMAGAIAHHFNNILAAVLGNLEMARVKLPKGSDSLTCIDEAMKASHRAVEMTRFMVTYLGRTTGKKEPLDLAEVVGEARTFLSASVPCNIHLRTEFPSRPPIIHADGVHIKQILTNLVSNAVEAIGEEESEITVTVEEVSANEIANLKFAPLDFKPKARSYARISVADSDSGLDATTIERIFDPFFTTKFPGRGMGLPVVLGLMRSYEGAISVESTPGKGSVFRVYFPIPGQEEIPGAKETPVFQQAYHGELILVVDDEPMIRTIARSMLERIGFEVVVAGDGREAVEIFRARKDEFSFVLLDLNMPEMNGWQALAAIRGLRADISVILTSGYDEAQVMQSDHPHRPQAFLHKPYVSADLKEVLDAVRTRLLAEARGDE